MKLKEEIKKLREEGKSYSEIQKILGCAQSTIAYHINDSSKEKAKLRSRRQVREICKCGALKPKGLKECRYCSGEIERRKKEKQNKRDKILNSTIEEYLKNYNRTTQYTAIRRLARVFIAETNLKKCCSICGFNDYVEVCHIKPVKDFKKTDKIKDVNNLSNLVYLCPNHHKLLDLGKLKL